MQRAKTLQTRCGEVNIWRPFIHSFHGVQKAHPVQVHPAGPARVPLQPVKPDPLASRSRGLCLPYRPAQHAPAITAAEDAAPSGSCDCAGRFWTSADLALGATAAMLDELSVMLMVQGARSHARYYPLGTVCSVPLAKLSPVLQALRMRPCLAAVTVLALRASSGASAELPLGAMGKILTPNPLSGVPHLVKLSPVLRARFRLAVVPALACSSHSRPLLSCHWAPLGATGALLNPTPLTAVPTWRS